MRAEERELMKALKESVDSVKIAIIGDETLGIPGLVKRQENDEQNFIKMHEQFSKVNNELISIKQIKEEQWEKIDAIAINYKELDDRVKGIESFTKVINNLPKYKKIIIKILTGLTVIMGAISAFWEHIKEAIK